MVENTDIVTLSTKKHYKVAISFALNVRRTRPNNCVFDASTASRLLREVLVELNWFRYFASTIAHG